jgi:hypothetical protein
MVDFLSLRLTIDISCFDPKKDVVGSIDAYEVLIQTQSLYAAKPR